MISEIKQFLVDNAPQIKKVAAEGTAGGGAYAYTLNEWVAITTIGYVLLQGAYLIWKWVREAKGKSKK